MTIKKILATLLALSMTLSLAACGGNSTQTGTAQPEQTEQTEEASSVSDESASDETTAENTETETPADETEASEPAEKVDINLAALSGPTALGMLDLLEKNENGEAANNYNVTIATAPDEVTGKIISGELDIAAVPTNVASTLYNKTEGQVQIAALNTMGVLYVLETGDTIQSVADLAGKTIYATGQGSTPEYALNLVLEKNGLTPGEDVEIVFAADNAEIAPLLASGEAQVALLPQPFVTSVLTQNENVRVALDLTEEWDKAVNGESGLTMGCVVVRKEFAEQNKEALDRFLDEYKQSVETVTSEEGLAHAAELAEHYNIIKAAVAEKAIPECNIVFVEGDEMQQIAGGFLQVLYDANPQAVGGQLPNDDFYYKR